MPKLLDFVKSIVYYNAKSRDIATPKGGELIKLDKSNELNLKKSIVIKP